MGSGASTSVDEFSVNALSARVALLGEDFKSYSEKWNLDGSTISKLTRDEKIQKLKDLGIENEAHQNILIAEFEKMINKNSAFVFIKPHANTSQTQELVKSVFLAKGVHILAEGEIKAEDIDKDMLIDNHYYAIGKFL